MSLAGGIIQKVAVNTASAVIEMQSTISKFTILFIAMFSLAGAVHAQGPQPQTPKTLFFDSDGNQISNNEFVDIRMANFHYKDQTLVKTLEDGTIEFRLQKIPQEGAPAPSFTAKYIDGRTLNFANLRGKVVVLNFWFVGCPACRAEMPKLNEFRSKFKGNGQVEFIAMTADPAPLVKKYLSSIKFDYAQVVDAEIPLKQFVVGGYPKNIVIGKDGTIVYWRSNIHAWEKFESVVKAEISK
jgi:thiol-disulfide isomerase/thioredoxin